MLRGPVEAGLPGDDSVASRVNRYRAHRGWNRSPQIISEGGAASTVAAFSRQHPGHAEVAEPSNRTDGLEDCGSDAEGAEHRRAERHERADQVGVSDCGHARQLAAAALPD